MIERERQVNAFESFVAEEPILVIGKEDEVKHSYENENNIIICYDDYYSLEEYPTSNPVVLNSSKFESPVERSNYSLLVGFRDGLTFDYHNREYVRELIYSLAYYQKVHNIKQMTPSDTWNVYRKIYRNK